MIDRKQAVSSSCQNNLLKYSDVWAKESKCLWVVGFELVNQINSNKKDTWQRKSNDTIRWGDYDTVRVVIGTKQSRGFLPTCATSVITGVHFSEVCVDGGSLSGVISTVQTPMTDSVKIAAVCREITDKREDERLKQMSNRIIRLQPSWTKSTLCNHYHPLQRHRDALNTTSSSCHHDRTLLNMKDARDPKEKEDFTSLAYS